MAPGEEGRGGLTRLGRLREGGDLLSARWAEAPVFSCEDLFSEDSCGLFSLVSSITVCDWVLLADLGLCLGAGAEALEDAGNACSPAAMAGGFEGIRQLAESLRAHGLL